MSFGAWLTCKCSNIDRLLMTCLSKLWSRWTSLSNSCCRGLKYGKPYVICIAYAVLFEVARPSHCAYSGIRHVPRKFPRHSVRRFVFVAAVSTSALISVQACASLRRVALVKNDKFTWILSIAQFFRAQVSVVSPIRYVPLYNQSHTCAPTSSRAGARIYDFTIRRHSSTSYSEWHEPNKTHLTMDTVYQWELTSKFERWVPLALAR